MGLEDKWRQEQDVLAAKLAGYILKNDGAGQLLRQWAVDQPIVEPLESVSEHVDWLIWRMNLNGEAIEMNAYLWSGIDSCLRAARREGNWGGLTSEDLDQTLAHSEVLREDTWRSFHP